MFPTSSLRMMGADPGLSETRRAPLVVSLGMVVVDMIHFADGKVLVDIPGGSGVYSGFHSFIHTWSSHCNPGKNSPKDFRYHGGEVICAGVSVHECRLHSDGWSRLSRGRSSPDS